MPGLHNKGGVTCYPLRVRGQARRRHAAPRSSVNVSRFRDAGYSFLLRRLRLRLLRRLPGRLFRRDLDRIRRLELRSLLRTARRVACAVRVLARARELPAVHDQVLAANRAPLEVALEDLARARG